MAKLIVNKDPIWQEIKGESFFDQIERQVKYLENLKSPSGDSIVGAIIKFPVADGNALYKVEKEKPCTLSFIPFGDCYCIPDAFIRGLTLKDVRQMVEADRKLEEIMKK